MELDDFRRQWQRSTPPDTAALPDGAALAKLLSNNSYSPAGKMRRNVWSEIGVVLLCLVGCVVAALFSRDAYYLVTVVWIALICVLSGFYFRRKLALLNSLNNVSGTLLSTVVEQLDTLRELVSLYFRATMWSLPVSLGIGLIFIGGRIVQKLHGQKMLMSLAILLVIYSFVGLLAYWGTRRFTRWYLQRLYGRYLDQLEAALSELRD